MLNNINEAVAAEILLLLAPPMDVQEALAITADNPKGCTVTADTGAAAIWYLTVQMFAAKTADQREFAKRCGVLDVLLAAKGH